MSDEHRAQVVAALDHTRRARAALGSHGVHRTRVLLDMVLLSLAQELAHLDAHGEAAGPSVRGRTG